MITEKVLEAYFGDVEKRLFDKKNRKKIKLSAEWVLGFEKKAGVYLVFLNDELAYVGETGSLQGRMGDLRNTKNHTLRRSIGEKYFSNSPGYTRATSRDSYNEEIESKLNKFMEDQLTVSCQQVFIGRKEFEEWIQRKYPETKFLNKRSQRK